MGRRLFTALSVFSLLLCASAVALWVRSYYVSDWFRRDWSEVQGRRFFFHVTSYTTQRGGASIISETDLRTGDPDANPEGFKRLVEAAGTNNTVWEHTAPVDRYNPTLGWNRPSRVLQRSRAFLLVITTF